MVPSKRLELLRLSAPPPQDGVSTNSTTTATALMLMPIKNSLLRDLRGLFRGSPGRRWCRGSGRRRFGVFRHRCIEVLRDAARLGRRREIGEPQARGEEYSREDGRGARQEVRGARGAEQAARRAAAERGAHVGALAMLQEHEGHDADRGEDMENQDYRLHRNPFFN